MPSVGILLLNLECASDMLAKDLLTPGLNNIVALASMPDFLMIPAWGEAFFEEHPDVIEALVNKCIRSIKQRNGEREVDLFPVEISNDVFVQDSQLLAELCKIPTSRHYILKEYKEEVCFRVRVRVSVRVKLHTGLFYYSQ